MNTSSKKAYMHGSGTPVAGASSVRLTSLPGPKGEAKAELVGRLMAAKEASGRSYSEIADAVGLTNAYVAQLFLNQAQLQPNTAKRLKEVVPFISDADIELMCRCPFRSVPDGLLQEPFVYRLQEAVMHYGEGLKAVTNEMFGDGIMSAIDFYVDVNKVTGTKGEDRVVITFNGKYLPHIEQVADHSTAAVVMGGQKPHLS
eukprot:jgi/Mesvir1/22738/Mv14141-RA.1